MVEDLLDVGLEEICGDLVLLKETVDVSDTLFGVFLDKRGTNCFIEIRNVDKA